MKLISNYNTVKATLALLSFPILPTTADYCTFDNNSCIDGLAQVSVPFQFNSVSPAPLLFYYGFDGGIGAPGHESTPAVKLGYWLHYDKSTLEDFNSNPRGINWTTEVALRIVNSDNDTRIGRNGCDGVWNATCEGNLKKYLRSSLFDIGVSGLLDQSPLSSALQPLTAPNSGVLINGCPSTLFWDKQIPSYALMNATNDGGNNASRSARVAAPGSPATPWRTYYIPDVAPVDLARKVAVGIVARGPVHDSNMLKGPDDIEVELICARAPKHRHHHPHNFDSDFDHDNQGSGSNSAYHAYSRAIIKTYAFDENSLEYGVDVEDEDEDEGYQDC